MKQSIQDIPLWPTTRLQSWHVWFRCLCHISEMICSPNSQLVLFHSFSTRSLLQLFYCVALLTISLALKTCYHSVLVYTDTFILALEISGLVWWNAISYVLNGQISNSHLLCRPPLYKCWHLQLELPISAAKKARWSTRQCRVEIIVSQKLSTC